MAADGSSQAYAVTVTILPDSAKAITGFAFTSPSATGTISAATHTIALSVPYGTNVTALVTSITISGASVSPASGVAQDFTHPVTYTVTAADGSSQAYTVTVTIQTPSIPAAPTDVAALPGNGQITLSWTPVSGATSYNIYWATSSGVTKSNGAKISGATSPYIHSGLSNGSTYYYVITAVNVGGESAASSQVSATCPIPVGGIAVAIQISNNYQALSLSPSSLTVTVGTALSFTSSFFSGVAGSSWQWFVNGTQVPGQTTASFTYTPTAPGYYTMYATVLENGKHVLRLDQCDCHAIGERYEEAIEGPMVRIHRSSFRSLHLSYNAR